MVKRKKEPVAPEAANQLEHVLYWHGDNMAEVTIAHSGLNPSMRSMGRTLGVNLTFQKDCIHNELVLHPYINTQQMCADIFTKFFAKKTPAEWTRVCQNVNIYECYATAGKVSEKFSGPWEKHLG